MGTFATILEALQLAAATANAAARARAIYDKAREQAAKDKALTDEESAALDAEAEKVFGSAASQPSGRTE